MEIIRSFLPLPCRTNYRAERRNGDTAMVVAIDAQGSSIIVEKDDGERQMLDLRHLADQHVRSGWVRTIHSAQGATATHVIAHLESFRVNTVDTRAAYVAISRAREGGHDLHRQPRQPHRGARYPRRQPGRRDR